MREKYLENFPYDKNKYHLVIQYFQYMLGDGFLRILNYMKDDKSLSSQSIGYSFASSCDEEDKDTGDYFENGVMFWFGYNDFDEIIVDYSIFYNSLKLACEIYMEENSDDNQIVNESLKIIRNRYGL